uniref:thioredoxin-dependent peroxiredoxin n=1 Tax=Clastoptera arizonana TaxID=38151 RepID=A0A1B6E202_9HEMI
MNEEQVGQTITNPDQEDMAIQWGSDKPEHESNPDIKTPGGTTVAKKKGPTTRKQQKYRKAWEFYPEFEQWLECDETNVYKARCKMCCKVMVADLSVLQLHSIAKKHLKICEEFNKAKATLASISTSQPGRANLPPSRKVAQARSQKVLPQDNLNDISVESLTLTDSIDASAFNIDPNYSEQGTEGMRTFSTIGKLSSTESHTMMSKAVVTKVAPNWKATAIVNGHVTRLELLDYRGRYVVMFFYPHDFSALCPTEILALSDRISEFRALQTEVVACSVDSHLTHLAWARTPRSEGGLANPKIPLLADPTHSIAKDYGVLLHDVGHTLRAHFIIDCRGIIRHMGINDINVGRSIDELLRLVQALQHVDETESGCPADWKPGQPTV